MKDVALSVNMCKQEGFSQLIRLFRPFALGAIFISVLIIILIHDRQLYYSLTLSNVS